MQEVILVAGVTIGLLSGHYISEHREQKRVEWEAVTHIEIDPSSSGVPDNAFELVDMTNAEKVTACRKSKECSKLAEAITWEARGETREGQRAVASVILNRVDNPRWPDTIEKVVDQRYQFSYHQDKHKQSKPTESDWNKAYLVAYNVKHGIVPRVTNADHYLAKKSLTRLPRWARVYTEVGQIGNHTFYSSL